MTLQLSPRRRPGPNLICIAKNWVPAGACPGVPESGAGTTSVMSLTSEKFNKSGRGGGSCNEGRISLQMVVQRETGLEALRKPQGFPESPPLQIIELIGIHMVVGRLTACDLLPLMAQANELQVIERS